MADSICPKHGLRCPTTVCPDRPQLPVTTTVINVPGPYVPAPLICVHGRALGVWCPHCLQQKGLE